MANRTLDEKFEFREQVLSSMLNLSDQQLDPKAKESIRKILGNINHEEAREEILNLLDDCTYGSLCSSFEIKILEVLYENAGGTQEEKDKLLPKRMERIKVRENS